MTRLQGLLLLLCLIFPLVLCESNDDELTIDEEEYDEVEEADVEETEPEEPEEVIEQPEYTVVETLDNAFLFDNFQTEEQFAKTWTHSSNPEFPGRFNVGKGGNNPSLDAENGLYVPREAQRYAIFGELKQPFDFTAESTFVVQYEVRLHEILQCGGAYIKLTAKQASGWTPDQITNETPYTFMFGPDKCGSTNKVHFIWKFQNPVTEEFVEHHLTGLTPPSSLTSDKKSHLLTLVVRNDETYEIFIDMESLKSGSLLTDFEPPLNPPKIIDDPEDKKPEDWVNESQISDPDATKPDDWDEDAPRTIADPEAFMPEGWNEDAPLRIADPDASEPADWDEEDDGEWEAPEIDNPACSVGCGQWKAPMIDNPDYKGKWYSPKIDNPDYVGPWSPKQIDNPDWFDEDRPYAQLGAVAGVAIDIWTMQRGIEYDNFYVGTSEDLAWELAENWKIRRDFQNGAMNSHESASDDDDVMSAGLSGLFEFVEENFVMVVATFAVLVLSIIYFACCGSDDTLDNRMEDQAAEQTEQDQAAEQDQAVEQDADAAENKDEKEDVAVDTKG